MKVKIKLIEGGVMPKKQHADDAAFDCYARVGEKLEIKVYPDSRVRIPLGFALELPSGWEAQIRPRSGLTLKGIDNGFGTIDANYRGEVCAIVCNNNPSIEKGVKLNPCFVIHDGDRICQMVIKKLDEVEFEQVDEISETERGSNGFGSTGDR